MNFYFIDFENVHSEGFAGIESLGKNDTLYLMYTEHCKAVSIEALEKICRRKINLEVYRAGTGTKNALDFQLSSFMGYIIAKNEEKENSFYIVSKDTGFNPLIDFWKEKGVNVKRIPNFSPNSKDKRSTLSAKPSDISTHEPSPKLLDPIKPALSLDLPEPVKAEAMVLSPKSIKNKAKKSDMDKAAKSELLALLSEEEYSDRILEIINSYKTKVSIKNALDKEFRDSQRSSIIYKKLKSLLKDKKKT